MSDNLMRLRLGRRITWRTVVGLLLVPPTVAGVLLWGLWNPTDRLRDVTAAVVNLDEPVTVDGQTVPMGRLLAAELIGDPRERDADDAEVNFTWVLTDESDADAGLEDGRYATVVTIPEEFSSAATSASRGPDDAETATIDIRTSDRGRLLDQALSSIVTTTATNVLNEQLGTQFVGQVFVGMTQLGAGLADAAGGAEQLADGGQQLATGARQLADGTSELSNGVQQLASGAARLADGAGAAAAGGAQLASGVEQYTGAVNEVLTGVQTSAPGVAAQLQSLYDAIDAGLIPMPTPEEKAAALKQLEAAIAQFGSLGAEVQQLIDLGDGLASGVRQSAAGQAQLAGGVAELSSGVSSLAAGTPELATGARQLADGAQHAADGTAELADGLRQAGDGVPSYTDEQSEQLAGLMVRPVEADGISDELFNASGVPLFAGIALWAGALAAFLVLAPLWRRTRDAARGVAFVTLRSAVPAVAIGAAQGALAGGILPFALGYDLSAGLGFFALAVVAGISFALVNQGLSALLGGLGRFLSFALLVVAFAIGVISTAPPLLQAIGDASPIGALFAGFQAVATGNAGSGGAILALILWGLGGLVLTAFAVARARNYGTRRSQASVENLSATS